MRIVHSLDLELDLDVVLTIGTFDGIHRGHQHLLEQLVSRARQTRRLSAVLTFYPHPRTVLHPEVCSTYLSTPEERALTMELLGLDLLVMLPFTHELAETRAEEFIRRLYERLRMRELWVGVDFAMGRRRKGNTSRLQSLGRQLGYVLRVIDPLCDKGKPISSSRIRVLLSEGHVGEAARLLGRYYAISGQVIKGEGRGQSLGFRTANLRIPPERVMPSNGVYAVWVAIEGQRFRAVANLGVRPSFGAGKRLLEVHLLDYEGDLYDKTVDVEFVQYLRPEEYFADVNELVEQIHRDNMAARVSLSLDVPGR